MNDQVHFVAMMGPKIIIIFFFLFMLINTRVFAQAPDVGKIFIGTQGNRSDPTEYRFNENAQSISGLSIPFSAVVFQEDGTEVSKDDEIEVFCVNEFSSTTGYTQLVFTVENLPAAFPEGQANYGLIQVGRAAVVRCYGISVNFQCPATTNLTVRQPEFCRETSISDPITITMTPAPVVSICERVNRVPSFTTNTYVGTFQVVLSEAVGIANVTVTCTQVSPQDLDYCRQPGVSCCQSNNQIRIPAVEVPEGGTTATMSYTITRTSGRDVCVGVRCSANSVAQLPEGYFQYTTSSSSDSSSQGLFQTVTPDVYMEPQYLTIYNTSFQSVLYLDASVDVPIQCQASVVNTLEEALDRTVPANIDCTFIFGNATTTTTVTTTPAPTTTTTPASTTTDVNATAGPSTLPPTTTPLPTPPIDPSSPWITVDNSFTITAQNKFHVVQTSRELLVIAPTQEIVVTTCCSTVTNVNSNHWDLKVATVAVAELEPRLNTTGGATSGIAGEERFVVNPAYREVAPCPCDLTYLVCDINCCCDAECTDPEKETFSGCIPGRQGGQDTDPDLRSCKSDHFPKDDWFPLLCVQFESNALLGSFYTKADKLNTAAAVSAKLAEENKQNVFTYRETESRFSDLSVVSGYKEGSNILTIHPQGGNLLLPQPASSGYCLDSTPVKFLHDSDSTCTRTLTPETCADLTPFSAHVYVQPSSLFNPACPRFFAVSSTGRDLQDEAQRVNVQVNYLCANDVSMYIKNVSSRFSDFVSSGRVSSFPPGLQDANCTDLCGADSLCLGYNQGLDDSSSSSLPPRCSVDNSFELPSVPTYSAATRTCQNVVLDVRYRFSWAGQSITGLTADVVLGNVVLPSAGGDGASVSQRFSAVFTNDYSGPFNQSDNYQNVDTPYQRSGKPGYDFGKPVATGCNSTNGTSGASSIDQSEVSQMAVWSPGQDGLCENAKRRFLTFGDDMQSSCVLRQTFNDINNCDSLKTLVLNHLNVLMPANAIGRYGYNDPYNNDMWIEILREDPFSTTDSGPTDTSTITPSPTSASTITPDQANASTVTAGPTNATIATTGVPVAPENTTFDPLSVRSGVCQNIVSGIHLEIMYAETGRSYNYPLLEIIGAAVRYSVSNWSMSCVGPNAVRCQNNSAFSQPFLVTSSVQYTKVSPTTPHQPILFYQIHDKESCDSDTCYRFFEDFDTSICHHDTCWHELFYPLTQGYQGYEGVSYTRGFSLVMALFILGYVAVTKPWK